MLIYLSLILALFCFFVAIFPLKISRWWKLTVFVIMSAISQKYLVMYLFGGKAFFAPALPREIMLFTAWLYAVLICWFGMLLISVTVRCGIHLYRKYKQKEKPAKWDKWVCRINFILLGISIFCMLLGLLCGTSLPAVKERTIYLKDLPLEADGMRIALLSDLHIDYITKPEHLKVIVQRVNAAKPDLTVITGDYIDGSVERCGKKVEILKDLKAPYGVWGIPGNHEYYSGYQSWMYFLEREANVTMLLNRSVKLPNGVYLAGTTDPAAKRFWEELPDVEKAAEGIKSDDCAILLAHNPKLALEAKNFFDLQLSGHTHGGMIRGMDLVVKLMNKGFVSGLYQVGDMQLYVTNGTYIWSGFPIRLGRPSEITLITLKKM